jgi:hypothetical protein
MVRIFTGLFASFCVLAAYAANTPPEFAQFRIAELSSTTVKSIDLSGNPKARIFKTTASRAIGQAANFAGHYVVVTQGCGSPCQAIALVDVGSGKVYPAPFSASLGISFRVDSRLLVESPTENIAEYYGGSIPPGAARMFYSSYYEWVETSKKFRLIYSDWP